jgi:hypothetical protein
MSYYDEYSEDNSKIEDRLINYGLEKKEKHLKLRAKKTLEEIDNSYHPEISEKSQIMATFKRRDRTPIKKPKHNKSCDILKSENIESDGDYYPSKSFVTESDLSFTHMQVKNRQHTNENLNMSFSKNIINTESSNRSKTTDRTAKKDLSKSQISNSLIIRQQYCDSKSFRSKSRPKTYKNTDIHEFLYQEAEIQKQKNMEREYNHMKKECPFTPTISEAAKKFDKENKKEFIDRLVYSKRMAEEIIVRQKEKKADEKNLFKPMISTFKTTREGNLTGETFYDQRIYDQKKKVGKEENRINMEKKKLWMETSMKSILKMKIDNYKELFDKLDSDNDGFISSKKIRLSDLDSNMLKNLAPLLEDLQTKYTQMDFKQFCLEADKHLAVKIFK